MATETAPGVTETRQAKYLSGYVAKFNHPVKFPGDGRMEVIKPGAFSRMLADDSIDVVMTHHHDRQKILGRRSNGSLELREDDVGLHVRCKVPSAQWAQDLWSDVVDGNVNGGSFTFSERSITPFRNGVREMQELWLDEVCATGFPVDYATEMSAYQRALDVQLSAESDHESRLRRIDTALYHESQTAVLKERIAALGIAG